MQKTIAFIRGIPPAESFPKEKLVECAKSAILNHGDLILQYADAAGYDPLREWIAEKQQVNIKNVILGQGSLQLLDFFIHSCLIPGDLVFVEQPTYDRSLTLFKRSGVRVKGFDLMNGAIDLKAVEDVLLKGVVPKAFYVIPDFQNPSGALMSKHQRQILLNLAKKFNFLIIEDGPYRHLRYSGEPEPSFIEQDKAHVIHMSSFSKMISPGLRVGYMIAPESITPLITQYAEDSCINSSYFNQAVVFEFIRNGWLDNHIESLFALYGIRLKTMLESLQTYVGDMGDWLEPQGGFFVGLTLKKNVSAPDSKSCKAAGIALSNSKGFFIEGGEKFLRLPFCALSPEEIKTGILRLSKLL
jgi:2-aminoadipate transaminase